MSPEKGLTRIVVANNSTANMVHLVCDCLIFEVMDTGIMYVRYVVPRDLLLYVGLYHWYNLEK